MQIYYAKINLFRLIGFLLYSLNILVVLASILVNSILHLDKVEAYLYHSFFTLYVCNELYFVDA